MHSRKRSAAFLSEDTSNGILASNNIQSIEVDIEQDTPSKRLQHSSGIPIPTTQPKLRYNVQRLLNNLAFTRLYVTANFPAWDPSSSPVVLCCVNEQNELYAALCQLLPSLYGVRPNLQALAVTNGYLDPNAMSDSTLSRILPLTTTAGLESTVAEEFDAFRQDLGPADRIAAVSASGLCVWTSWEATSLQDMQQGLASALTDSRADDGAGADVAMPDG